MLWKRRKTPRLQSIVQHGGRRHPLRATKAMPTPFIQMPCKQLALLQLTDATNVQPCTAGTPKKKGACRRLAWLQRQTGFWTQQKDASTNHKQLTSKLLSCELLIVCTCKLLLQSSKIFRRTWTLHLCPVWATADCESVHRSCPRCGSKIHSQQVSVLGQLLNGILSRCIPWRTPVSSGLRSTKTFFKWNVISTHRDFLGVDSSDQKRHTRNPVKLSYLQGRRERVQRTDASRPRPPCP